MIGRLGEFVGGVVMGLINGYRNWRKPTKNVACANCHGPIPARWDSQPPAGYVWTVDRCPHCKWSALDGFGN